MKKLALFFFAVIVVIASISYMYLNYKTTYAKAKNANRQFESYLNKEINGLELTTIINKAVDNNEKNEVQKDAKTGKYIDNETNSINIDIKMLDYDKTYYMEMFYNGGMDNFIQAYGEIKFKCTKIEYHKNTKMIKYIIFEQITQ